MNREQQHTVARVVLAALAIGVAYFNPALPLGIGMIMALAKGMPTPTGRAIRQVVDRFEKRGLVRRVTHGRYVEFKLTEKGREQLDRYTLDDLTLPDRPAIWDGKWRIVLFDVPEQRKYLRTIFRHKLQDLGFVYLQKSSWLYPFSCENELSVLAKKLGLEEYVAIATAHTLSNEEKFLRRFKISRTVDESDYHFISLSEIGD